MAKKVGLVRSKGVTSGRYCGGSESAIPPSEAWKLLNNSIEPARYSRAKVEYRSVRPEIPMSPVKSLRSRLPPQWRAFDLDGRGPRPSSQGERGKEIRKRFWTQSHDRGPRRRLQTVSQLLRKWRRALTLSSGRTIRSANGQTPD